MVLPSSIRGNAAVPKARPRSQAAIRYVTWTEERLCYL